MTDHRDFKRRVRDRQAHTGESYMAARARAGIGGTTHDGYVLAMHIAGRDGLAVVMCTAWHMFAGRPPTIVLTTIDDFGVELWGRKLWEP